ncbi:MAG: hypothetical protein CSYNP_01483 [Syntrophus sp. SKADARSKE-3]|nr:hypothetical protein [Syntrophus sp. SKADARSKE-3]
MDKNTKGETVQSWKNSFLNDSMMVWKEMMPIQVIKPYLSITVQQQKTLLDMSSIWMNYLTTLARKHREAQTNGGNPMKVLYGISDASEDLVGSCVTLMDKHIANISKLHESSGVSNKYLSRHGES